MTCEYTWPNHLMASDQEATRVLLEQHGYQDDVAYGHTKVFIRTPRTLVCLEQERARLVPIVVLLLQKVGGHARGRRWLGLRGDTSGSPQRVVWCVRGVVWGRRWGGAWGLVWGRGR